MVRPDVGLKINLWPSCLLASPRKHACCLLPKPIQKAATVPRRALSHLSHAFFLLHNQNPHTWMLQTLEKHHLPCGSCQAGDSTLLPRAADNSCLSKLRLLPSSVLSHPTEAGFKQGAMVGEKENILKSILSALFLFGRYLSWAELMFMLHRETHTLC